MQAFLTRDEAAREKIKAENIKEASKKKESRSFPDMGN